MYGIAVDDAHTFKQPGNPVVAGPGRGWVVVRAPRWTPAPSSRRSSAATSMRPPASSFAEYEVTKTAIALKIRATAPGANTGSSSRDAEDGC